MQIEGMVSLADNSNILLQSADHLRWSFLLSVVTRTFWRAALRPSTLLTKMLVLPSRSKAKSE